MMPTTNPPHFRTAVHAATLSAASLNDRLAEAAHYAVLNRLMPVLRHEVAGAMQPARMLLMVLEKRLQTTDPDLQAIAKNVTSVNKVFKEASTSCLSALGWVAASEDIQMGLRSFVDQSAALLAMELFSNSLTLTNGIEDDSATASLAFLRSVFIAALLAFCDQHVDGGTLEVTLIPAARANAVPEQMQLHVRMLPNDGARPAAMLEAVPKYRMISWADVGALALSGGVPLAQGDGWMTLGLPALD